MPNTSRWGRPAGPDLDRFHASANARAGLCRFCTGFLASAPGKESTPTRSTDKGSSNTGVAWPPRTSNVERPSMPSGPLPRTSSGSGSSWTRRPRSSARSSRRRCSRRSSSSLSEHSRPMLTRSGSSTMRPSRGASPPTPGCLPSTSRARSRRSAARLRRFLSTRPSSRKTSRPLTG